MTHRFAEIVVGGVLVAPFLGYAVAALILYLMVRPLLRGSGAYGLFAAVPVVEVCLYVCVLAAVIVLF